MNRRKIALALRMLAEAIEEEDVAPAPTNAAKTPRTRPVREARLPSPEDAANINDIANARADQALRRRGLL